MEILYGLKYSPSVMMAKKFYDVGKERPYNISKEHISANKVRKEISDDNIALIETVMGALKPKTILEIGVMRNLERSFTRVLLANKAKDCIYVGVDIMGKRNIDSAEDNIHTIREDSGNYHKVLEQWQKWDFGSIDLLFIDGYHSVYQVEKDWRYAELLSPNGLVLLHDTNFHDGAAELFKAIDDNIFEKKKHFEHEGDWGMAIIRRRKGWKSEKSKNFKVAGSLEILKKQSSEQEKPKSGISDIKKPRSGIGTTIKKPQK